MNIMRSKTFFSVVIIDAGCVIVNCCSFSLCLLASDIPRHNIVHDVITYVNSGEVSERLSLEAPFFRSVQPVTQQTQLNTFLAVADSR